MFNYAIRKPQPSSRCIVYRLYDKTITIIYKFPHCFILAIRSNNTANQGCQLRGNYIPAFNLGFVYY